MPKKSKRRESNRVNRPADQNFRRGKNELSCWANFWNELSCQTRFAEWKKHEKKTKKWTFSFFFIFFHSESSFFFWSPKKVHSEILPTSKVHFFSFRKNVRSKSLFFVYLLVSKFQVQIPYPKPGLNPKSLGFRV